MTIPGNVHLDFALGDLVGAEVATATKTLSDVATTYADSTGYDSATETCQVCSYTRGNIDSAGNLYAGMTVLRPLDFNGELNMTRGHYHADRSQGEIYVGVRGEGLLLSGTADGRWWVERVRSGSVHHISGDTAHRLVNTGTEDLRVFAVWPTVAGHDYEAITPATFGVRVFKDASAGIDLKKC